MKHKISIIVAALLAITMLSCREATDRLMTYDHIDHMAFAEADTSFAGKFKVAWNGLNQYYAIWDYEAEMGVDWDDIYDKYLPKFEALDRQETVSDDELLDLMRQAFSPLHDGHLAISFKNHKTGTNELVFMPNEERLKSRDDYEAALNYSPSLNYYKQVANDEIMTDADGNPIAKEFSSILNDLLYDFVDTPDKGVRWIKDQIEELKGLPELTEPQAYKLEQLESLLAEIRAKVIYVSRSTLDEYNQLAEKYASLQVPGFDYIDPGFWQYGMSLKYALLKGNIAYFYLSDFRLTPYLSSQAANQCFNTSNTSTTENIRRMQTVWYAWFNAVQQLHKQGALGGVIIDVRGNGGGMIDDFKFIAGSLLPGGKHQIGYQRFKNGTGRYDYSVLSPCTLNAMADSLHEPITEPVVIMSNCRSISMAEMTVLAVKTMPNGTAIGKRSSGGKCSLKSNNHSFTNNYMGYVGVRNETPVYVYLPSVAYITHDNKIIEGIGITPDIEVDLDANLFEATGQDTQLDRALQFIRTGN